MKNVVILLGLMLTGASGAFAADAGQAGDADAGKAMTTVCGACHGADGNSASPFPKLAGQGEKYLLKQLRDIRTTVSNHALDLFSEKSPVKIMHWLCSVQSPLSKSCTGSVPCTVPSPNNALALFSAKPPIPIMH